MGLGSFIFGGALQGAGSGLNLKAKQDADEHLQEVKDRRDLALLIAKAEITGPDYSAFAKQLKEAGVDPASKQGQAMIQQHLANEDTKVIATTDGGAFERSPEGKITSLVVPGEKGHNMGDPVAPVVSSSADLPVVNSPDDARQLPPGTRFRTPDGRTLQVPGGAGGNASGGFPNIERYYSGR